MGTAMQGAPPAPAAARLPQILANVLAEDFCSSHASAAGSAALKRLLPGLEYLR